MRAKRCVCMVKEDTQANKLNWENSKRKAQRLETLDALEPGKDAVISAVNCADVSLRKHILDMGLTPGTEVTLVKRAPMGDPIELRLRGYELTLRSDDASHIEVNNVHEAHNTPRPNPTFSSTPHPGTGEAGIFHPRGEGNPLPANKTLTLHWRVIKTAVRPRCLTS